MSSHGLCRLKVKVFKVGTGNIFFRHALWFCQRNTGWTYRNVYFICLIESLNLDVKNHKVTNRQAEN